jgi:ribonuclease H-related protein
MAKKNFYAVKIGKTTGIFTTWSDCEASIHGYPGAKYRGFATLEEAKQYLSCDSPEKPAQNLNFASSEETAQNMSFATSEKTKQCPNKEKSEAQWKTQKTEDRKQRKIQKDTQESVQVNAQENELTAYVDGSFEVSTGVYSFGCVFLLPKKDTVGLSKTEKEDAACNSEKEDCMICVSGSGNDKEYCMICASGSGNDKELAAIRNVAGEMLGAMYAVKTARKNGYKSIRICYDYLGIEMWATGKWKTNNVYTKKYAAYMKEQSAYLQISFQKIAAHTGEKWNEEADRLAKEALCAPVGMPETLLWRDNASSENNASI